MRPTIPAQPGGCPLILPHGHQRGRAAAVGKYAPASSHYRSSQVDAVCFPAASPQIRFNSLATEWERSEQTGIATLVKGLFKSFRNPAARAPKVAWATSRSDALDMLTLASMLHRRLDKADVSSLVP